MPLVQVSVNDNLEFHNVDNILTCVTCDHYIPSGPGSFNRCKYIGGQDVVNLITGEEHKIGNLCLHSCGHQRRSTSPDDCGIKGQFWLEKGTTERNLHQDRFGFVVDKTACAKCGKILTRTNSHWAFGAWRHKTAKDCE